MLGLRALQRTTAAPAFRRQLIAQRRWTSGVEHKEFTGAADNAFNRERAAVKEHAAGSSDLWRKMSIYIVIPCLCMAAVNAWRLWDEHWEHKSHEPPLEEKVEYPYQNIRTKKFFWGDGDKTAFWNTDVNYHKTDEE
ncbi:hypothetical protein LTS16_006599 [Friedmanniomyces endolithicus]|uniref:Cytochrome c oxidase subunit n=1 Tax=Friedmanniomyces endolithicus TaxID=329885 RepID=A0A4U0TVZ2_9PEZI|nr:hypothetical protein LTS09_008315 [Friedmanniomyces endolithicus]KAK0306232.1 hypothetical protein LTR82_016447 [Friedmanniomyces endolithicus]KAK1045355.1 hypothetical protein LTS16_006599 [Friedmanniomyces endolithicus]KAK1816092.1 hypothetical protein LTR12_009514 [Friedmanniomyces endolithicus]TKA26212.1 hypothetical protein B0A54_16903 [Friedmanniomyces endolithicus]